MKKTISTLALGLGLLLSGAALAAERTVTLAVENLTCPTCPYIVKKTLSRVPGVTDVAVSLKDKTAEVTFDDSRASVDALTQATGNAGYPSQLVERDG